MSRSIQCLLTAVFVCIFFCTVSAAGEQIFVWWEGEEFEETNVPNPVDMSVPGNATPEQQAKLSGGRWLTPSGPPSDEPYFVRYRVEVPATGDYGFWGRKFWRHGPFRWRFGNDEWRICGRDIALHDHTFLQMHWGAYWVFLGDVELEEGTHTFQIEMLDEGGGAIDCFLLIDGPFMPRGKLRPGERSGNAHDGFFAWEPDVDPLADDCPIDLRSLNEEFAGIEGFVRRDGDRFVLGDGRPVRFWMVQANLWEMDNREIDRWARRLAKYGVNLVRMQFSNFFNDRVHGRQEAFERRLDRVHYTVAALKREGIYSYFGHFYWHTHNPITEDVFPGFGDGRNAIALLIFSEQFQEWYKDYVAALMTPENPYTGVPLAREPAVAFVEIWNESSLLFWTFNPANFPATERDLIEKHFGDWLAGKYGSLENAAQAWGEVRHPGAHTPDRFDEGRAGLYTAGHLTSAGWAVSQRNTARAADQLAWMIESTLRFYENMRRDLREEVGIHQMVSGSNWTTADPVNLGGLERYSYTPTDVVLRNTYYGVDYAPEGNPRFFAVDEGDTYRYHSSLRPPAVPGSLLTPLIAGHTFMITENNWTRPNRYRAEWPFLVATYAQMHGVDGWNFFSLDSSDWQHTMGVWDINNPTILGQFPAAALVFRRGDVTVPDRPAVLERIPLADAYAMKGARTHTGVDRDALWVARLGEADDPDAGVDPKAFFIGPVLQEFGDVESSMETVDLSDYIDTESSIVRSMTDELAWDFATGVVTLNTPRARGASGFLGEAGRIELDGVAVESGNEYGTIMIVSLDGEPLEQSGSILIQTATWDKPYGFETRAHDGYERIVNLGGYPLNVEKIDMVVEIRNAAERTVVILDENGYPTEREADRETVGDSLIIRLPQDTIYTLLQ